MPLKRLLALATLCAIAGFGCSTKNPAGTDPGTSGNMSSQFGGYTTTAEAPQFGDAGMTDMSASEAPVNDPTSSSPVVEGWQALPGAGVYHMRFVWGRLTYDSTATTVTVWDGSLQSSRGALIARRRIRFEDGDSLKTRVSRNLIEWVSKTRPHNDGLAADLILPPVRPVVDTQIVVDSLNDTTFVYDTLPPVPATVTFATAPFTITLDEHQLALLDTVIDLGDGLSVSISSIRHNPQACPRGILAGQFAVNDSGQKVFRGFWLDPRGHAAGAFRGFLGVDSLGHNTFFGKWIDSVGNFEGLLRGRYEIHRLHPEDSTADTLHPVFVGRFEGGIFDNQGMPIGQLKGHFIGSTALQSGFLEGRWKLNCPSDHDDIDSNEDGSHQGGDGGGNGGGNGDGGPH